MRPSAPTAVAATAINILKSVRAATLKADPKKARWGFTLAERADRLRTFEKTRDMMPARFARRAEHFYSEYRRVRQGVTAWETGNLQLFGKLSFDSCESSMNNYECGSPELISIYKAMRGLEGVYGGRFSGAGFKGAVIALVDPKYKEQVERAVTERYLAEFPEYEHSFKTFWVKPDDGARFVED